MRSVIITISALMLLESIGAQTTLTEYTTQAVEYSTRIEEAELRGESAEAELRRIRREYLPELSFERQAEVDFNHSGMGRPWSWGTTLELSQVVWHGGAISAERDRQQTEVAISELNKTLTLRGVVLEAKRRYCRLSYMELMLSSMEHYNEIVVSLRDVIKRRYDEGYSSKGDLLQIESRLSDAEYQLSSYVEQYEQALHSFNTLVGNDLTKRATLSESILTMAELPKRCNTEALEVEHPERRIAELRAEGARHEVRRVNSTYLPRIDLRAYGTLQPRQPHTSNTPLSFGSGAMLGVSSVIYHFGERHEAVAAAKSEQLVYELEVEDIIDDIRLREQDAWTRVVSTHERLRALERGLGTVEENLEISTYAYNEGQTTILDVMQAQISWLQTYRNVLGAHYDYAVAVAEYSYITGY